MPAWLSGVLGASVKIELELLLPTYAHLRIVDSVVQARLAASLEDHGQQVPVLVTAFETRFVLIDGYRRLGAASALGWASLDAVILDVEPEDALLLYRQLQQGCPSALEDGWYLQALLKARRVSQQELAVLLGRSASWVSRRLSLVRELPESVQQTVREGRLPPDAAMKYLVPLSRGNAEHAARIVAAWKGRIPTAGLRALCEAWSRATTDEEREALAGNPRLYLQIQEKIGEDQGEDPPAGFAKDPVLKDLRCLTGICGRARRTLDAGTSEGSRGDRAALWRRALTTAWADLHRALARLDASLTRRGVLNASGS